MDIQPQDIFIQKERNNRTLWVSHDMLLRVCTGLSDGYLRKERTKYKKSIAPSFHDRNILPDSGKAWRFAKIEGSFFYCYNNIPDKAPSKYKSQLPAQDDMINAAQSAPASQETELEAHFKTYLKEHYKEYLHCYGDCTKTQQENLSKAAAVMESAICWIKQHNVNLKKYDFINEFTALIKKYDVPYLPQNERIVKAKLTEIITGNAIAETIKLPRKGNSNAEKHDDEEITSWVLQLRGMEGLNFTNAYIIRKIKNMCLLTNKPVPSDRWIGQIMEQHNTHFLTAAARFGSTGVTSKHSAIYRGYVPMQNALFAGDCWQVDGTRVNLIDHKGDAGKRQFLYIIAVRDVHSGELVGWHFDINEDRWAVFNAVKMAAKETGYLPYEIVFDRFPGHNTPEMKNFLSDLEQCGTKVTFTHKATGKPGLERWFGTLQTVFMQESKYYYGQGITSRRKYAHRSAEYISRLRKEAIKEGFDWDDAVNEATNVIEAYRNTAYCVYSKKHSTVQQTPSELHEASEKPNVIQLQEFQQWYLFGLKKTLPLKHGGLITTEILKSTYYYRVTDYNIISNNDKVVMCYDLEDLSKVMLFKNTDNAFRQYLGTAEQEAPAQVYGSNPEWGKISKRVSLINEVEEKRKAELQMKKAAGSDIVGDMAILAPLSVNKPTFEISETQVQNQVWNNNTNDDDGEGLEINIRTQY